VKTNRKHQRIKSPRSQRRGDYSGQRQTGATGQSPWTRFFRRTALIVRRNGLLLRSCIIFAACLGLTIFAYSKFINEDYNVLVVFTAKVTGAILSVFDSNGINVDGTLVSSETFSMRIVTLCTGLIPSAIFVSAILAYPSKLKHKILGIITGIVAIYSLNLVRMVSIFYIGVFIPSFFDAAHGLIWQSITILLAIVLWLFWVEKLAHDNAE
jgi:exosortase H (IPTLxxWG-CTERM-specific)